MSISPSVSAPWTFVQWAITGIATVLVSFFAFVWRLTLRVDRFESSLATYCRFWDANASATEAALVRLAERLSQIHDEGFRVREMVGALPTRSDLRDLEGRVLGQLGALEARLDRSLERQDG